MHAKSQSFTRRDVLAAGVAMGMSAPLIGQSAGAQPAPETASDADRLRFAQSLLGKGARSSPHSVAIRGVTIDYTATVGATQLHDAESRPSAIFVYTAYTRRDAGPAADRPVTFVWGGGPSGPAAGLNFNVIGPKRRAVDENGRAIEPARLIDNPDSILDRSDLVMVDPVGTGFSVPTGHYRAWDFYSVGRDAAAVAQFIRLYLMASKRKESPLFVLGQSYGTLRLPVVITNLQAAGCMVSGGILISSAADGNTIWNSPGHIEPYYLKFPNFSAVAWYHGRQPGPRSDLQSLYRQASRFALNEFLTALVGWPELEPARRAAVAQQAYRFTGISARTWSDCALRMSEDQFAKELLRSQGVQLRADDARETVKIGSSWADNFHNSTLHVENYLRDDLGIHGAPPYVGLAPGIYEGAKPGPHPWDMTDHGAVCDYGGLLVPCFPNFLVDIAAAMNKNPSLRIQQHSGLYDLSCASFQANWGLERMEIPARLRSNIQMFDYESGHGVYLNAPTEFRKFTSNVHAFYGSGAA